MPKKISGVYKFLMENGLLFEINRKILHPLGLTLEIVARTTVNDRTRLDLILWDYRKDPEGVLFSQDAFSLGRGKYQKYLDETGMEILISREEKLGFLIQEK